MVYVMLVLQNEGRLDKAVAGASLPASVLTLVYILNVHKRFSKSKIQLWQLLLGLHEMMGRVPPSATPLNTHGRKTACETPPLFNSETELAPLKY